MKKLLEHWRAYVNEVQMGADMAKSIEYTAFVLDAASHESLSVLAPEDWKVYSHHMTMIPPTEQGKGMRLPTEQFFEGCLRVTGIAQNEQVMAAQVDLGGEALYFKIQGQPHVTIATNPATGGKPAMSNDFAPEDFKPIEPIQICGKVEEVPRK